MQVALGSDHAGFELKEALKAFLTAEHHEVVDVGTHNADPVDYPDYAYKGGPNTGVFLQITCDDAVDLPVPGQKYTFGVVKAAQARGDFQVLVERNRRALRAHLGADVAGGLATLHRALTAALTNRARRPITAGGGPQ